LASEATIAVHNFPSFSQKALDLEAKLGHSQAAVLDKGKKKLPQNWKAKGQLMFVDHDGNTIEIDEDPSLGDAETGGTTSEGGVVAAAVKSKGTSKRSKGRNKQPDPNATPWDKVGLAENVWRDRYDRSACIRCGQYGHNMYKCRNRKVTEKIAPTMGLISSTPSSPQLSGEASASASGSGNT
jgi:hypothetical protein